MIDAISPFTTAPSSRYYYVTPQAQGVFKHMMQVPEEGLGLAIVAGPVGHGKSSLVRYYLDALADKYPEGLTLLYVPNPTFASDYQFVRHICHEIGIPPRPNKYTQTEALKEWLVAQAEEGNTVLLVVDEAHRLNGKQLEVVRELFNFNTGEGFLINTLLVGEAQPLKQRLKNKEAIRSRAMFYDTLDAWTFADVDAVVRYRLTVAGLNPEAFHYSAIDTIYRTTEGNPREVMKLCRALWDERKDDMQIHADDVSALLNKEELVG